MRKHIKDKIMTLIKKLEEAHRQANQLIRSHNYGDASNVLASCQKGAFSIGTTLEESETGIEEAIAELETYCDYLFDLSGHLQTGDYDLEGTFQVLDTKLKSISEYIRNQIKIHYEVVFLPYEATMWDSMESVWTAADADPECRCFVIPIPYFKRTSSSETMKMEYDGKRLPGHVPVTHYEKYSLKDRKPDIIYIHNPYDDCNLVTTVHPAFYSSELKKHTPLLVYIPYYITGGTDSKTLQSLPVHQYMDKMVVQGDKALDFYKESVPADKLVALGSPKVDRMVSALKSIEGIPAEWALLIRGKKVIFYNTSIAGCLENGENELDKMEYVFSVFKNRKEEALLWRPHPLLKTTLQAVRPDLYQRYCEMESNFAAEKIGILDTTQDIAQSVAIADAYIGEKTSSVVHMFGVSGKPIFLLDMDLNEKKRKEWLNIVGAMDAYFEDGNLWFMHCHCNALCKTNITTGETLMVDTIPDEPLLEERLYSGVSEADGKLYFAPNRAKEMLTYDLRSKQLGKISYKVSKKRILSQFNRIVKYNDCLFFLPTLYPAMVKYNLSASTIQHYYDIINNIKKNVSTEKRDAPVFYVAGCKERESLLLTSIKSNAVAEFNMNTGQTTMFRVGNEQNTYVGIAFDGNDYWLITFENNVIVRWNRESGKTCEYIKYPEGFKAGKSAFFDIICCGEYMLVFPKTANMILKIDIATGYMSEYKLALPYKEGERKESYYSWPNNYYWVKKLDDEHVCAMTAYDSSLIMLNTKTQECNVIKCWIDKRKTKVEFGRCGDFLPYASMENYFADLDDFLYEISSGQLYDPEEQKSAYAAVIKNMDGTCGIKIHEYMMKSLNKIINKKRSSIDEKHRTK